MARRHVDAPRMFRRCTPGRSHGTDVTLSVACSTDVDTVGHQDPGLRARRRRPFQTSTALSWTMTRAPAPASVRFGHRARTSRKFRTVRFPAFITATFVNVCHETAPRVVV